jgi:hypothetical protein
MVADLVLNSSVVATQQWVLRHKNGLKREIEISRQTHPQRYDFVAALLASGGLSAELQAIYAQLSENDRLWLAEEKILLPASEQAENITFECPLDLTLPELLPLTVRQQLPQLSPEKRALFGINPRMVLQTEPDLDETYAERVPFREVFSERRPVLWVREPLYEMLLPYWPSPEMQPIIQALLAGQIPPDLSDETFHVLVLARILLLAKPHEYVQFQAQMAALMKAKLEKEQYLIFQQWLSPILLAAMRGYYREIKAEGYLFAENSPDAVRTCAHNDPLTCYLQTQMTGWLNRLLPEAVKPTYTFVSYYDQTGMGKHIDWEQCAWNISVMVDPVPEEAPTLTWPLFIQFPETLVEAHLEPGDAILYKGTDFPHWREDLPPGHRATVSLFHFVHQDYVPAKRPN